MNTGELKVFTCNNHDTFYPVGGASIVVAYSREQARELLDEKLVGQGLKGSNDKPYTLYEVDLSIIGAEILANGDY